jgi:hypothetical protein
MKGEGNLGRRAQDVQIRLGLVFLGLALVGDFVLDRTGLPSGLHFALAPLFFLGTYGLAAGLTCTCGFTALAGRRLTNSGPERIANRAELGGARRQGMVIVASSGLLAIAGSLLLLIAH